MFAVGSALQKLDMIAKIFQLKEIRQLFEATNALPYRQLILMNVNHATMPDW